MYCQLKNDIFIYYETWYKLAQIRMWPLHVDSWMLTVGLLWMDIFFLVITYNVKCSDFNLHLILCNEYKSQDWKMTNSVRVINLLLL